MATDRVMVRAQNQDYAAQIKAIRLAIGSAEGLKYKDGRPKAISQEVFADRIERHVSAVKKWELGEQEPDKDSIVAINQIAPPGLRIVIDATAPLRLVEPSGPSSLSDALDSAIRGFVRGPDGRQLSNDEWERLRTLILAAAKP